MVIKLLQITVYKMETPQFRQRVLIEQWHCGFIIFVTFFLEIASPHYQLLFLREEQHLVTNNANRPTLKFGHHHTPNRPESCHAPGHRLESHDFPADVPTLPTVAFRTATCWMRSLLDLSSFEWERIQLKI